MVALGTSGSAEATFLVNKHRYREAFHLSVAEFNQEPLEDINLALTVWKAENKKSELDAKRANQKSRSKHGK